MRFCLMVTGPAYGSQHASSAWLFASELWRRGIHLKVFSSIVRAY